jgi:hypothetical protein
MSQTYTACEKHCEQADRQANTGSQIGISTAFGGRRRSDVIDEPLRYERRGELQAVWILSAITLSMMGGKRGGNAIWHLQPVARRAVDIHHCRFTVL